jgi:hypothetical protein
MEEARSLNTFFRPITDERDSRNFAEAVQSEVPRTGPGQSSRNFPSRTGVKIALAAADFHSFGVARQGPWFTSVNNPWSSAAGLPQTFG